MSNRSLKKEQKIKEQIKKDKVAKWMQCAWHWGMMRGGVVWWLSLSPQTEETGSEVNIRMAFPFTIVRG